MILISILMILTTASAFVTPLQKRSRSLLPLRITTSTSPSKPIIDDDGDGGQEAAENNPLNPLLSSIKISKTIEVFGLVKQLQSEGVEVTSLCVGEPDFPPPKAVLDAAISAIQNHETRYTAVSGTLDLRKAIASDLQSRKGVTYSPEEILVSNGAKQSVFQGVLATCGVGDVALIPAPYWPSYPDMVTLAGGKSHVLDTREDGYLLTPSVLRKALEEHPDAKLLILCNPSNPTGGVHPPSLLEELALVLQDYPQVSILSDEIYERLIYSSQHISFASLPGMFSRTMTVNGFSKAYAMTGMRLGYLAAPKHYTDAAIKIQSQITSCAGSISQMAALAALTQVSEEEMDQNVQIMRQKRDFVVDKLNYMKGMVHIDVEPEGAFYILLNVSKFFDGDDSLFCMDLLKNKRLALVPGSSFGAEGTVRISYATSMEELRIAMIKLEEFLLECDIITGGF